MNMDERNTGFSPDNQSPENNSEINSKSDEFKSSCDKIMDDLSSKSSAGNFIISDDPCNKTEDSSKEVSVNSQTQEDTSTAHSFEKISINTKNHEKAKPFAEQEMPHIEPINQQVPPPYSQQPYGHQVPPPYQQQPYGQQVPPPYQQQSYGQQVPPQYQQQPYYNNQPMQNSPYQQPYYNSQPMQNSPYQRPYYNNQVPPVPPYQPPQNQQIQNADDNIPDKIMKQKKKKMSKGGFIAFLSVIVIIVAGFLAFSFYCATVLDTDEIAAPPASDDKKDNAISTDKKQDNEKKDDDKSSVVVNIPIQDKPAIADEYYQDKETGLLTTVGVNVMVGPSVVGIQCYADSKIYPEGGGSGIILSEDGYIITNEHVVANMKMYKVILNDGKEYKATLIGKDARTDIAVLKIDAKGLTTATFGNSKETKIGEQVAAIGNPGIFSNTASYGYVSAVDRSLEDFENGVDLKCIQTDAAVNPGNSGGPLVNMYGQVIGIVSSKYVSEGYENIGFAISINEALPIIKDILEQGYITDRVRLGIMYVAVDQAMADQYDIVRGLLVREIDESCAVAESGLQIDDIITKIDGNDVYDAATVKKALENKKPGDKIILTVHRFDIGEKETEITIETSLMQDTTLD